jgi:hypothetical protein
MQLHDFYDGFHQSELSSEITEESTKRFARFKEGTNLKLVDYGTDLKWLLGKKKKRLEEDTPVPFEDHGRSYRDSKTGERVLVSQPYICLRDRAGCAFVNPVYVQENHVHTGQCGKTFQGVKAASEAFAEEHGLTIHVSFDDSWHYPGASMLCVFKVKR